MHAIDDAGYTAGRDGIAIALDPASGEFHHDGPYAVGGESLSSEDMIDRYAQMIDKFPIWTSRTAWARATLQVAEARRQARRTHPIGGRRQLRHQPGDGCCAVGAGIGNAALIKVNQVGAVSQTLEALRVCRDSGYAAMISHRSGRNRRHIHRRLGRGLGCGQIKSGAPSLGERVAKYNRLLEMASWSRSSRSGWRTDDSWLGIEPMRRLVRAGRPPDGRCPVRARRLLN